MMAKVLQLSRFPLFGRHPRFPSPSETAAIVGLKTIRALALSGQLSSHLDATRLSAWPLKTLWSHSVKVGKLARKISRSEKDDPQQAEEAFAAGLLHDVGKLVLAVHFPQDVVRHLLQLFLGHLSHHADRVGVGTCAGAVKPKSRPKRR